MILLLNIGKVHCIPIQTVCQGFHIKKCIRSDCPDCTNETRLTEKTGEHYKTKINSLRLAPIRVFKSDQGTTQDPVQDGQNRNSAESPGQSHVD
jgi:hypothetical protein